MRKPRLIALLGMHAALLAAFVWMLYPAYRQRQYAEVVLSGTVQSVKYQDAAHDATIIVDGTPILIVGTSGGNRATRLMISSTIPNLRGCEVWLQGFRHDGVIVIARVLYELSDLEGMPR